MKGVDALLAEREIREVLARYCRGIDRGDVELVRECYHVDALDEHGRYRGDGRAFAEHAVAVLGDRYVSTMHALHQSLVEFDDAGAHVETYFVAYHAAAEPANERHLYVFGGRYVDRFTRRDGRWRIAHRVVVRDWSRRATYSDDEWAVEQAAGAAFVPPVRSREDVGYPAAMRRHAGSPT